MIKGKRRKCWLLCILLFGIIASVGCGKKESESATVPENTTEELVTVKWCIWSDAQEDDPIVVEEMNKILAERYNLQLELIAISPGEFDDRMKLMSSANEDYDLTFTCNWANNFYDNVAKEAFYPLDELLNTEGGSLVKEAVPDWLLNVAEVNGELYAVPNLQQESSQNAFYIQKDLADKYGFTLESVEHPSEIEEFLQKIKENEPNLIPICATNNNITSCAYRYDAGEGYDTWSAGGTEPSVLVAMDGNYVAQAPFEVERFVDYYKLLNEWYKKGYIRSDIASVVDDSAECAANKYAVLCNAQAVGGAATMSSKYGKEYIMVPIDGPIVTYSEGIQTMTAVNVNSKHPEEALKLIGVFYTDKELYNMLLFGLEGVHYNKVGENRVELIADSGYDRSSIGWALGNQFNAMLLPGQEDSIWEDTQAYDESAFVSPMRGFNFDTSVVQTEMAQLASVDSEFQNGYYYAEDFEAYCQEYYEKQKVAGIEKIVEEFQRQIDEWKLTNNK